MRLRIRSRTIQSWTFAVFAAAFLVPDATAQRARTGEDLLSRPAGRGPSVTMGGRFTAQREVRPLSAARAGNVALLGARHFGFRPGAASQYTQSLGLVDVGLRSPLGRRASLPPLTASAQELRVLTGLSAATRLDMPLPGMGRGYVPNLYAAQFTPRPDTTRFQDLMGLQPEREPSPGATEPFRLPLISVSDFVFNRLDGGTLWTETPPIEAGPPLGLTDSVRPTLESRPTSLVHALQAQNDTRIQQMAREAEREFRHATVFTNTPEELEQHRAALTLASNRLRAIRELDPANGLAPLLLAHAALTQARPQQATLLLLEALERDPEALQQLNPERHFGNPEFLDEQMRAWLRQLGSSETLQQSPVLEAYCAWRLGDRARMQDALVTVMAIARDDTLRGPRLMRFAELMRQQPLPARR